MSSKSSFSSFINHQDDITSLWSFDVNMKDAQKEKVKQKLIGMSNQEKEDLFKSGLMSGDESIVLALVEAGVQVKLEVDEMHYLFKYGNVTIFKALEQTILKPSKTAKKNEWFKQALDSLMLRPHGTQDWLEMTSWISSHPLWKDEYLSSVWHGSSFFKINAWMKAGGPMSPKVWTPSLRADFADWFTRAFTQMITSNISGNQTSMSEVLRQTSRILNDLEALSLNPLPSIANTHASSHIWVHALFTFGRNDARALNLQVTKSALPVLQLFLSHHLIPESIQTPNLSNPDTWNSWPWKAAQYGDKESLEFLLQNSKQLELFEKEWHVKGLDCLYNTDACGVDINLAIHAIPFCHRLGFDLTQLDKNGNSALHILAHALSASANFRDPLVLNQEWLEILSDLRPSMLTFKNIHGYTPWDYVHENFEVLYQGKQMNKKEFEVFWEQSYLSHTLPKSTTLSKPPRL